MADSSNISVPTFPSSTFEFVVHFISGLLLTTGIIWTFGLFECLKKIVQCFEVKEAFIDDILFAFIYLTLSYIVGHTISSLSALILQKNLDKRYPRPCVRYLPNPDKVVEEKCHTFSFFVFCFPIYLFLKWKTKIEASYYDKFLQDFNIKWHDIEKNKEKEFPDAEKNKNKENKKKDYEYLDSILKEYNGDEEKKTVFHYLESRAKSNVKHHAEIIFGHTIQYSFARNLSFCFSVLFFLLLMQTLLSHMCIIPLSAPLTCPYPKTSSVNVSLTDTSTNLEISSMTKSHDCVPCTKEQHHCSKDCFLTCFFKCFCSFALPLVLCFFLSCVFFLRFLDQYKRYVREIILTFVTEENR